MDKVRERERMERKEKERQRENTYLLTHEKLRQDFAFRAKLARSTHTHTPTEKTNKQESYWLVTKLSAEEN